MSDLMGRRFTRREKALILVVLIVLLAGLYFLVVHYPIVERTAAIERETEDLEKQYQSAQIKAAEYAAMKQELDEILAQPADEITVMPPYNNIETLMRKLDVIFAGTNPQFSFSQARITDGTAARTISFTCTAADYQAARNLLKAVTSTGYRCLLDSFTLTPEEGDLYAGALNVSGAITFYEHVRADDASAEA